MRAVFEGRHSRVGRMQYLCQIYSGYDRLTAGGCDRLTAGFALTKRVGNCQNANSDAHPDRCDRRTGQIG